MPKMKTNKTVAKKIKVRASGTAKRAQAGKSHLTAKMSPKRIRQLRGTKNVDSANQPALRKLLPYSGK